MKTQVMKYITILVLLALLSGMKAQVRTIHTGTNITISDNAKMTIKGDLKDRSEVGNESIDNLGQINLSGDLINQGVNNIFGENESSITQGIVRFYGSTNRLIEGISPIHLNNLHVDLPGNNLIVDKRILVNDSLYFIDGNLFLRGDTLVMNYLNSPSTNVPSGIVGEVNLKRIYGPDYPILVQNVTWNNAATYSFAQLKGIGIDFTSTDYLGANFPNIYRYNLAQQCGPMAGSVERTYRFDNISTPGKLADITARFHNPLERLMYTDADSMHIYVSYDDLIKWRDIEGDGSSFGTVADANDLQLIPVNNFSAYTITKDSCDILPEVYVHQILNGSDTLFDVSQALFCDPSNPNSTLLADGSIGDYYWITPSNDIVSGVQLAEFQANQLGIYGLVCTDARGCDNRKDFELIAAAPAEPAFTVPAESCDQVSVSFTPDCTCSYLLLFLGFWRWKYINNYSFSKRCNKSRIYHLWKLQC